MLPLPPIGVRGKRHFVNETDIEIRELYAHAIHAPALVEAAEVEQLPAPVERWLKRAGVVGRARATSARLLQRGQLRTSPGGPFMAARADQYFRIPDPAFIWRVEAKLFRVVSFTGRDRYCDGKGNMRIRLASLLSVVDVDDRKIAEGALLRFLAEIVWFPSAAVEPYVSWKAVDDAHATAALEHAALSVSATFEIDSLGRVVGITAQRFLGGGEKATLEPWRVTCTDWKRFAVRHDLEGLEVPSVGTVSWDLPQGNFVYYRWELVDLEFDQPQPYAEKSVWR